MNRRTFLKSLGIACGAAVVCPGKLVKGRSERLWIHGSPQGVVCKARQQGCTNSTLRWVHYYADYQYSDVEMKKLVEQLEKAFWNTKFKSPLMKDIDEPH